MTDTVYRPDLNLGWPIVAKPMNTRSCLNVDKSLLLLSILTFLKDQK